MFHKNTDFQSYADTLFKWQQACPYDMWLLFSNSQYYFV